MMHHHVFISHVDADQAAANAICDTLEISGVRCWVAPRDLEPGPAGAKGMVNAIKSSRVMLLLFSHAANHSDEIVRQVMQARREDVPVLMVRLKNELPNERLEHHLKSAKWMDALGTSLDQHLMQLLSEVRKLLEQNLGKAHEPEEGDDLPPPGAMPTGHSAAPAEEFLSAREERDRAFQLKVSAFKSRFLNRRVRIAAAIVLLCCIGYAGWRMFDSHRHQRSRTLFTNTIGMQFARIDPGKFRMGSPDDEAGRSKEEAQHSVKITAPFLLGTTAVTQKQWREVIGANPAGLSGPDSLKDDLPVVDVSWEDAVEFCKKLSEKEGRKYHLPTEAQWEYACRAGTTTPYNFGEHGDLVDYAWFDANSGGATQPVAQKLPNEWGLYDMHGNVWQWCADFCGPYPPGDQVDPTGPDSNSEGRRILRGGSWSYDRTACRSAFRYCDAPGSRGGSIGFRCAMEP